MYDGFIKAIHYLEACGKLKEGADERAEAMRLHALVDGLVLHHTTRPEQVTREDLISLVSAHLQSLLR
jgi:hypothetical protein